MKRQTILLVGILVWGCGDEHHTIEPMDPALREITDIGALTDAAIVEGDAAIVEGDAAIVEDDAAIVEDDAGEPNVLVDMGMEDASPPIEPPARVEPPDMPAYSHGDCPVLAGGPDRESSFIQGFRTGDQLREFRLMVPANYDGSEPLPLIFAWHWLNARSGSFVNKAELETAIEQMNFIAVLPDGLRNENDDKAFLLSWPFAEIWGVEPEILFFNDLLACVTEQFNIDQTRIYGIGVSAGALWLTYLATTVQADYFAAIEVLSGGLGDMLGVWRMEYTPQENKFPAMVLWGGIGDWLALSFHDASIRLRDELTDDDHFVVECTHDAGHGVPPANPPPGDTKFRFLWTFMFDHQYGSEAGTSPYLDDGLPEIFPEWCKIAGVSGE